MGLGLDSGDAAPRDEARSRGLWNLFLPGEHGAELTNLQYAPLAEISGRSLALAPPALNCAAPDTGNMEVLTMFGSEEQKERWLKPLLEGEIRSSFAMTEPDVASSDATNITTRIERVGDDYVINGRKWWTTGAMNPNAQIFIVMGKTDPTADRHRQQSMILVPRDTAGVVVKRALNVFGFDDREHGGHAEIEFDNVVVPGENLIAAEGDGFAMAQARLGPGRIHHCMRALGIAERAIELMTERARERVAFGGPLASKGVIREWVAESRIQVEQLRLLTLKTAWLMDTQGNRAAHAEIQAIKIATPATVQRIVDRAIQLHGGGGVSRTFRWRGPSPTCGRSAWQTVPTRCTRARWADLSCAADSARAHRGRCPAGISFLRWATGRSAPTASTAPPPALLDFAVLDPSRLEANDDLSCEPACEHPLKATVEVLEPDDLVDLGTYAPAFAQLEDRLQILPAAHHRPDDA